MHVSDNPWGKHTASHDDAAHLFPVDELDADLHRGRDAALRLDEAGEDGVIGVAPTGMASGYFLGQHDLVAIEVDSLPEPARAQLEAAGVATSDYEVIRVGRRREFQNRSLAEFAD